MIIAVTATISTVGDGSATAYAGKNVTGHILAIQYAFGDIANTADFTITGETTGLEILTYANVPAANDTFFPRVIARQHTDGAAIASTNGGPPFVCDERIKVVVAQGGASKSGTMTFYVETDTYLG